MILHPSRRSRDSLRILLAAAAVCAAPLKAEISVQIPWLHSTPLDLAGQQDPIAALCAAHAIDIQREIPLTPRLDLLPGSQSPQRHLRHILEENKLGAFFTMGNRKLTLFRLTDPPCEKKWVGRDNATVTEISKILEEAVRGAGLDARPGTETGTEAAILTVRGPEEFHQYLESGPLNDLDIFLKQFVPTPAVPPEPPAAVIPKVAMSFRLAHSRADGQKSMLRPKGLGEAGTDVNESAGIVAMIKGVVSMTAAEEDKDKERPLVEIDPLTNSVIIVDDPSREPFYKALISELDVERKMVEITASIVDIEVTDTLDWQSALVARGSQKIESREVPFRTGFGAADALSGALDTAVPALPEIGGTAGGLNQQTLIVGSSIAILSHIQALQTDGKAQVLSRPSVVSLDNHPARLTDKTKAFIPVSGERVAKVYETSAGLDLVVMPRISDRGQSIYLMVDVGEGKFPTTTAESGIANATTTNRVVTQAVVGNGQSLVIGGRYRNEQLTAESRVPLLGRIPLLGLPFKNKNVANARFQRLYIITPRLLDSGAGAGGEPPLPDWGVTPESAFPEDWTGGGRPPDFAVDFPAEPKKKPGFFHRLGGAFRKNPPSANTPELSTPDKSER